ncbi:MAG: hypothetical protein JWP57_4216 [Spirosoma sp.]|nr:hypothetical protein [Spirosoma sp.]
MTNPSRWTLARIAVVLEIPDEAFRPFARSRGIAWDQPLALPAAAGLTLAWYADAAPGATGPVADAVTALLAALEQALTLGPQPIAVPDPTP